MSDDINIGALSEALNNKADLDFNNVGDAGKENSIGWGMPDYSAGVGRVAGTTYTADRPGWIMWRADNVTRGTLYVNGEIFGGAGGITGSWADYNSIFAPVDVGDTYSCTGGDAFIFYPCKGAN